MVTFFQKGALRWLLILRYPRYKKQKAIKKVQNEIPSNRYTDSFVYIRNVFFNICQV